MSFLLNVLRRSNFLGATQITTAAGRKFERGKNKVALGDKSDVTSVQLPVRANDDDDEDDEDEKDSEK